VPAIREALAKALEDQGYEVLLAADGEEAMERLHGQRTDLVLLDLNKPVKNGWNTFEEVLSLNPTQSIILLAERSSAGEWEITGHPTWLVEKPVCLPVMLDSVRKALAESELGRARLNAARPPFQHFTRTHQARVPTTWTCEHWDHWGINE
jgi:CheY-like chemotaxis protein